MPIEALVLLSAGAAPEARDALAARFRITATMPPRILVIQGSPADLESLRTDDAVEAIMTAGAPLPALDQLPEPERLFVSAWAQSQRRDKLRPGDGLEWDAPGFEPPDRPRNQR